AHRGDGRAHLQARGGAAARTRPLRHLLGHGSVEEALDGRGRSPAARAPPHRTHPDGPEAAALTSPPPARAGQEAEVGEGIAGPRTDAPAPARPRPRCPAPPPAPPR